MGTEEWEKPSVLYRLEDIIINNKIGSFIYSRYINGLNIKSTDNILDFGSGSGAGSKFLAKIIQGDKGHLTCLDTSEYWIAVAKKRLSEYKNVDFCSEPVSQNNFKDNTFDVINIHYVLHDVEKAKRNEVVFQLNRVLKTGGYLFIREPQRENDGMPVSEIKMLMKSNGFKKCKSSRKNNVFTGVYTK